MLTRCSLGFLAAIALLASGSPGVRPRPSATDYPSHATGSDATLAAAIIPNNEAKKTLGADLGDYVVIEVGLFPAAGRDTELSADQFSLITDPDAASSRPADSDAVAAVISHDRGASGSRSPGVYTTADVGIAHQTYPDPVTGRRQSINTIATGAGVGVGVPSDAPPFPGPSQASRGQLEQRLWEKSLPDGMIRTPVAGYLYFPKPKKTKNTAWVLQWDGRDGRVKVDLPALSKR